MISVNELTKMYGDLIAVNNISFLIRKGEITGLLGPNGAGKTTTLRMLTCYLKPTSGTVTVGDYKADEDPIGVRKIVGYLPEFAPIYSDMMVYDYLNYIGAVRSIPEIDIKQRIREMSDVCGLDDVMHKNIGELSKGYKQRVGLAHAMLHDPDILILDEPTSGLDPNQIVEIRNLIRKIGKEKTVILSTHILSEVEATCDRVIIINKGNIVADGNTVELSNANKEEVGVSIQVKGIDFLALSAALSEIAGINNVTEEKGNDELTGALISSSNSFDVRPDIFRLVSERDWVLYEMKQERRTLENIFRELTQGGNNAI